MFYFLPQMLVMWAYSLCDYLLSCMFMICLPFCMCRYFLTNKAIKTKVKQQLMKNFLFHVLSFSPFFKKNYVFIAFQERRGIEAQKHQLAASYKSPLGIEPTTRSWNPTSDLLVYRLMLGHCKPLSHTGWACFIF